MKKIKTPNGDIEVNGLLYSGLFDKNNVEICEGDSVILYHKGASHICKIIFHEGMFCLKWSDGYINQYQLNSKSLEVVKK